MEKELSQQVDHKQDQGKSSDIEQHPPFLSSTWDGTRCPDKKQRMGKPSNVPVHINLLICYNILYMYTKTN